MATAGIAVVTKKHIEHLSDDIRSTSLYNSRHVLTHGYILPFIVLYVAWLYVSIAVLELPIEAALIGVAVIGILQVLACLFCHWFVQVRCLMTCTKVCRLTNGWCYHYYT